MYDFTTVEVGSKKLYSLLVEILNAARLFDIDHPDDKIYVLSAESSESAFYGRSNHCQIGVIAKSDSEARLLIMFLHMMYDCEFDHYISQIPFHEDYFYDEVNEADRPHDMKNLSAEDVVGIIGSMLCGDAVKHNLEGPVENELYFYGLKKVVYKHKISVSPENMELWTLDDICEYITNKYRLREPVKE